MIILIRHAQSEGNKNREIHQYIPDHRVKLTPDGWDQAEEAGRRLRSMLRPDDTLQFFTSPYRRTRETTSGILRSLTADTPTPSPFPRHKIKVFEEPRLREQDFGNFQPCSAEMERMWQERADYGHFFYRIPNGESAADAYDRVSGFNESLWRLFGEPDLPSVCVLVTHGLMTRVFLMKWYHWSVEYFEDLRNVNHCEFIIMKQHADNGKYVLQNELRTWSELKRRASSALPSTPSATAASRHHPSTTSPTIPTRRWGGCTNGCAHDHAHFPRRARRQNTQDLPPPPPPLPGPAAPDAEKEDHPVAAQTADNNAIGGAREDKPGDIGGGGGGGADGEATGQAGGEAQGRLPEQPASLHVGRDFGGSHSGAATPADGFSDESDYFPPKAAAEAAADAGDGRSNGDGRGKSESKSESAGRGKGRGGAPKRPRSRQEWEEESGMGRGARADALGDEEVVLEEEDDVDGDVEGGRSGEEETREGWDAKVDEGVNGNDEWVKEVERERERERRGFGEVY